IGARRSPAMRPSDVRHWLKNKAKAPRVRRRWPSGRRQRPLSFEQLEERVLLSATNEVEPNNALALATALNLVEDPAGSGFFTRLGVGALSPANDVDYWRFNAQAGDRVTVAGDGGLNNNSVYLYLRNANDGVLAQAGDYGGGHAQINNFLIPT